MKGGFKMEEKTDEKPVEEKKIEDTKEETETEEAKPDFIDRTNAAAKRLEDATKAAEEERLKGEKLYAEAKLGGETGGAAQVEKPKEETPAEYKDRILKEAREGR